MMEVNKSGLEVAAKALNLDPDVAPGVLRDAFEKAHRNSDQTDMKVLDGMIKGKVDELNNDITRLVGEFIVKCAIRICVPAEFVCHMDCINVFPKISCRLWFYLVRKEPR